jgi:hypothetical protein
MVDKFVGRLAESQTKFAETQAQMRESLAAATSGLGTEVRTVAGQLDEVFRRQADALNELRESVQTETTGFRAQVEQSARTHAEGLTGGVAALRETAQGIHRELFEKQQEMLERLEQASAAQTQQLTETVAAIRAEAVGVHGELVQEQQASLERLAEISQSIGEQGRTHVESFDSLRREFAESSTKVLQAFEQSGTEARHSAERHLQQLAAEGENLVATLCRNLESSLKEERESAVNASTTHLAAVSREGNKLVTSIVEGQKILVQQINALGRLLVKHEQLREVEKSLSSNLELLATSDSFKETLAGIDRGLNRLHPVLDSLSEKAGIIWPDEKQESQRDNGGWAGWFRRRPKGADHG